ncbi:MAG: SpaA isopeptide-forming pilin-related protein, partial [Coriobacteriaceae bacterium]|nr:SpaA isopeptide-forming pilin-related protein [Coriobacteriaceae bacterium]
DFNKLLPGAEFTLYRTARGTDAAEAKVEVEGLAGQYVAVATLDLGAEATKAIDTLERLGEGEKYYLVETKVPAGYVKPESPVEVKVELTDEYDRSLWEEDEEGNTTDIPADGLYNWTQKAKVTLDGAGVRKTAADGTGDLTNAGADPDTVMDVAYWKISNNPGVELPSTGGPGTWSFTIVGSILVAAAVLLLARRSLFRRA